MSKQSCTPITRKTGKMIDWNFEGMKPNHYGALITDPPWRFANRSAKGEHKNAVQHYDCMSLAALRTLPVADLAAKDCALIMWATAPLLPEAVELMRFWGFDYKSAGTWAKQSSTGNKWAFGTGYCFRSASEFFLLGTRGKPKVRSRSIRNLIVAPVREHSRKPDAMHDNVEALYEGPYGELFAREGRPGWDTWGNETEKFTALRA